MIKNFKGRTIILNVKSIRIIFFSGFLILNLDPKQIICILKFHFSEKKRKGVEGKDLVEQIFDAAVSSAEFEK